MKNTILYKKPTDFLLFGGGNSLLSAVDILLEKKIKVSVCSSPRHIDEVLTSTEKTLRAELDSRKVPHLALDDVNGSAELSGRIGTSSFGMGFGPAWIFGDEILRKFDGRLVNFMGIRMPHFLGGAHYTWQILKRTRHGAANFQLIEKKVNSGAILFTKEYHFVNCSTPEDFFSYAETEERKALSEFLNGICEGREFALKSIDDNFGVFYPHLNTGKNGWINWSWAADDIVQFINAFGAPYDGASTTLGGDRIFIRKALFESVDGGFHPFQSGMIYRANANGVFIAGIRGSIVAKEIRDEKGMTVPLDSFQPGMRFFTSTAQLEDALLFEAKYSARGLKAR